MVESHRTIPDPRTRSAVGGRTGANPREDLYWDAFGEPLEEFGYTKSGFPRIDAESGATQMRETARAMWG